MTIDELKKLRPYLVEPLNLYERVLTFENKIAYLIEGINTDEGSYPPDLVDVIVGEFSEAFDISIDILAPLKEAIRFRQVDFLRLPLKEVPSFSLPYLEEETEMILFLLGRPFFSRLRKMMPYKDNLTEGGRCPVCHSIPSLSSIKENEERVFYCAFCGHKGRWSRIGCPSCLNKRGEEIEIITTEEEKGLRLELCRSCKNYIKTFQRELYSNYSPDLIDILSMPFDMIAQSKGFTRSSPNPLGMRRIL